MTRLGIIIMGLFIGTGIAFALGFGIGIQIVEVML